MHIVSWNVASWEATSKLLAARFGGLARVFERLGADIMCLQEVKIRRAELEQRGRQLAPPGFEAFWACCEGGEMSRRAGLQGVGWNGVATFAKSGTVCSANARPLGDAKLDAEGRCLVTDHDSFVLFNVYAPNASSPERYLFKLRFLSALRRAVQEQQRLGKRVVICGDLNLAPRAKDMNLAARWIDVAQALQPLTEDVPGALGGLLAELRRTWAGIETSLRSTLGVTEETVQAPSKGTVQRKYRICATRSDGVRVKLGKPCGTVGKDSPPEGYSLDVRSITGDIGNGPEVFVTRREGWLRLHELREAMERLASAHLPAEAWQQFGDAFGQPAPAAAWVVSLGDLHLVDAFATAHPEARARFTCWNQSQNGRYNNAGSRIDLFFIDSEWWQRDGIPGELDGARGDDTTSEVAAMRACTADGAFRPAPYEGGGIPDAPLHAYERMFREAHTGIIYTPPDASDHVAVSLLLRSPWKGPLEMRSDAATKFAQPHKKQLSIAGFFKRQAEVCEAPPKKRQALTTGGA